VRLDCSDLVRFTSAVTFGARGGSGNYIWKTLHSRLGYVVVVFRKDGGVLEVRSVGG
jgi:hypothetical protein